MTISMIAAISKNLVIGKDNDLVWRLPDDMKYFMETTSGHPVIMGRKNYESIPEKFRPLPNRTNIIITRNPNYRIQECPDCIIVNSLEDAITAGKEIDPDEIFIIGGGEIYQLALPQTQKLYLTEIHEEFDGDAYFPKIDYDQWLETSRVHHKKDDRHAHTFDYVVYHRQ